MRKIDRAMLKRALGGEYTNGPRASWVLINEAEGRAYFLGWNSRYEDYTYPLRNTAFYPAVDEGEGASKSLLGWHRALERVLAGELEACLVLQVASDAEAAEPHFDRVLDGVFFGEVVKSGDEVWFRTDDRLPLKAARALRQPEAA